MQNYMQDRLIDHFTAQIEQRGFKPDSDGTALCLGGIDTPASVGAYSHVESFVLSGKTPEYVALMQEKSQGMYYGHKGIVLVPSGGLVILYWIGATHYQGFFNQRGEPLEQDAIEIQERLLSCGSPSRH